MQTQQPPSFFDESHQGHPSHHLAFPTIYTEHCAPATPTAFERCTGQAMQSLSLPPPTALPPTPFGRRQEPGNSLAKFSSHHHQTFSPARPEHPHHQHSYPSPPMSDSHSPGRRPAHIVEPEGRSYAPVSDQRIPQGIAPPPQHYLGHRPADSPQVIPHQRPLYPGEPQHHRQHQHQQQHQPPPPQHQQHQQHQQQQHHYQPARAIEPTSYGGMQIAQNYAYGYPGHGVPSYLGPQGPGPQAQPAAIIAPPPLRTHKPARRTKAHVASACVNCKKAHLSCDVQRPCGRCVASGKQDTCKDVQHKKRGRPRLRDDKDFGRTDESRAAPTQLLGTLPPSATKGYPQQSPYPPTAHRGSDPLRGLRTSTQDLPNVHPQSISPSSARRPSTVRSYSYGSTPYSAGPTLAYHSLPVAFLNLDLVLLKSNQAFQDLVSFLGDVRGKNLADLLEARQTDVLQRIRNELRDEREEREPTYMAPITPLGQDPLHAVSEREVDQVSQGYTDRPFLLNFRLPNSQYQSLQTQIRLAKTSLYFVTLVVHTPPRPTGPPLLTQQLAPPTPVGVAQSLSAQERSHSRDFGVYSARPPSSASSAPTSPYFNFSQVRTSLPTISSSTYGNSPSYSYSPTAGPEQGYFSTIQPPSQPGAYPSPYPPVSRNSSVTSELLRTENSRPGGRLEGLQLPPIRTAPVTVPPPLASPLATQEFNNDGARERVRRRDSPSSTDHGPETPDAGKRRRLNIHEVLE
ncbi:hypothetical protein BS50DRAFT_628952 [Corynespora cassiicola Philippines]|uniref:Zn(2)-C6 fungal-type domain-containing protein n=1 Tax=Corynespora cassiicola Philippines TaxID=1448308 RepID=A0A2T2P680_CORCC|nr:hypothetical protein BS50DRAFT_628952 [Corynespora cassiicola Philippines]